MGCNAVLTRRMGIFMRRVFIVYLLLFLNILFFACDREESLTIKTANEPPVAPYQPQPKENETVFPVFANVKLTWNCYDPNGDLVLYDVYINGNLVAESINNQFYEAKVDNGLTYKWLVVAKDDKGNKTVGPTWVFRTSPLVYIAENVKVSPSTYLSWEMVLAKGDKIQVEVTSDTGVNVWLFSEQEFNFFEKNEKFNFFREGSKEKVTDFSFSFVVPESGKYRLVLDNRFSWFTSKNVFVIVYWSHYD